ncbi:MAG: pilus assembly PilX N-terminal domain-containing protein [Bacillota bacterium]
MSRCPGLGRRGCPRKDDTQRATRRGRGTRADSGVAFITVLLAVSFISIITIACITLVTLAARTTSWSAQRTKALYAAEAGINHWLFEATIEESGKAHPDRHSYDKKGRGHGHAYGRKKGNGPWDGGSVELSTLEVAGEINGVAYTTYVDSYSSEDNTYRLVSVADSFPRDIVVSVSVGEGTEVWRHVLYARQVGSDLAGAIWDTVHVPACDLSRVNPSAGVSRPILWDGTGSSPFPVPDWELYRSAVAPQLDGWDWPEDLDAKNKNLGSVFTPTGSPPFYYRNVTVGTILGPVDGDLYLYDCKVDRIEGPVNGDIYIESCSIEEIAGPVHGSIFVRNLKKDTGVGRIVGTIDGSVCVQCREVSKGGGKPGSYELTLLGSRDAPVAIGGSLYVAGRVTYKGGDDWLPVVLCLAGPEDSSSVVSGGVFAEDASVYILGSVSISRVTALAWPAMLSRGAIILNGAGQSILINGPVYSQAGNVHSLGDLLEAVLIDAGWSKASAEQFANVVTWPGLSDSNPGLVVVGSQDEALAGEVVVNGNVVSPGMPLITSTFVADYDERLLDSRNEPPYFIGGKKSIAPIGGTWSMTTGQGTE